MEFTCSPHICMGFLPQPKIMQVVKLPLDVNVNLNVCVHDFVRCIGVPFTVCHCLAHSVPGSDPDQDKAVNEDE